MAKSWQELVSQPQHQIKTEKDFRIVARDGVTLAADVYRPDADGKFPALLSYSPYGKDMQHLAIPEGIPFSARGSGGIEAGMTDFWVPRGYAHVIADVRGTGLSGGKYTILGQHEQEDGYDMVEWIARQPWCNGNVGMMGMSYFAVLQYLVAALNPPHLKAIFAYEAWTDLYRHEFYHGGMLGLFNVLWPQIVLIHTPEIVSQEEFSPAQFERQINDLKNNVDIQGYPYIYSTTIVPQHNPITFDAIMHPYDGPYWWERSASTKFDQIKIPVYCLSRWNGWVIHLPGTFSAYNNIKAPKKLMLHVIKSTLGQDRPWHEHHEIALRWYDHWLKGIDTGIMKEPPINIFVQGRNEWRYEQEWPLARTKWTKFYLNKEGGLSTAAPAGSEKPDAFTTIPWIKPGSQTPSLKYTTEPLKKELEITGPSALYLYAALSNDRANWIIDIKDIAPDGTERVVTKGWLKATHRELDQSKSRPYQPYHPHTRSLAVEPDVVYEYAIEIRETSNVFLAGHRLQLVIRGQDSPREERGPWDHLPNMTETRQQVFHTDKYPSYLLLPVIPE